jgi:hypothetical protein
MSTRKEGKKADGMENTVHMYDYDCFILTQEGLLGKPDSSIVKKVSDIPAV